MTILAISGILIAGLMVLLAFFAVRESRWWLVPVELVGLAGALLAVTMELQGTAPRGAPVLAAAAILSVLLVNVVVLVLDLRAGRIGSAGGSLPRPGVLYRMINSDEEIQAEITAKEQDEITEGLQALELWRAGNQAYLEGNYLDALSKYDLSARWIPSVPAYVNAAAVCLELDRWEEAEQYAGFALAIREDCVEAWVNRGLACDRQRKLGEALEAYQHVAEAEPGNPAALLLMGRALRRLNRLDDALRVLEKGLELVPDNPELLFEKSLVLLRKGKREEAVPHLVAAVKRNPKHHAAYFHLANTLNRLGKGEEALHYYNLVLKLKPDYPEAWNNRGIALSKSGKLDKAVESYRKALSLRPEYYEAWINLALAHDSKGDYAEALQAYRRFLDLAPPTMTKHIELTKQRIEELRRLVPEQPAEEAEPAGEARSKNKRKKEVAEAERPDEKAQGEKNPE